MVRLALSNKGDKVLYLASIRLVFRPGSRLFGDRLVLDPAEDRVLPLELAEGVANVLRQRNLPVELVPGDSVGYRFELIRLANTLRREGHTGDVQLAPEVTDRPGNVYRRPFEVDTELWAYTRDSGPTGPL